MEIRPSSELRNNYPEISKIAKENNEPVFITKNGHGDTVILSVEMYKEMKKQNELYETLCDAVSDYIETPKEDLIDSDVVFTNMKNIFGNAITIKPLSSKPKSLDELFQGYIGNYECMKYDFGEDVGREKVWY